MNKKQQENKGFALLLSIIVSSIALSIGLSMLHITLKQLSLGSTTLGSEVAFQAAYAGADCLRYMRKLKSVDFTGGHSTISIDCLGVSTDLDYDATDTPVYKYTYPSPGLDWTTPDGDLCIDMEIYIVDASNISLGDQSYIFPDGAKICLAGDVCTFAFSRGYNRSCTEIASSIFAVQREVTVEF